MKSPFRLPWFATGGQKTAPAVERIEAQPAETKMAAGLTSGFAIVSGEGVAHWSGRSYAALARTGFTRNPVAYRAMPMSIHIGHMFAFRGVISPDQQPAGIPDGYERLITPYRRRRL